MVAFSASRLVCSAIDVITLTTLPISTLEAPSFAMVSLASPASRIAVAATRTASAEDVAISRMLLDICSVPAATVCTLSDIWAAVPDRLLA